MLFVFLSSACAGNSGTPISPSYNPAVQTQESLPVNSHYLWAYFVISYDSTTNKTELIPFRNTTTHWNVLQFLQKSPCSNCVKVKSAVPTSHGTTKFDLEITHPFSNANLTGFDVRGIAMFNGSRNFPVASLTTPDRTKGDGELVNADGYSTLYNSTTMGDGPNGLQGYLKGKFASATAPSALLNGYKRHISAGAANTRNALYAGDKVDATTSWQCRRQNLFRICDRRKLGAPIHKPVTNPITDFPVTANCSEPWNIVVSDKPVGSGMNTSGGQAILTIDVDDWQGKDSHQAPVVECPELIRWRKASNL